MSHGCRITAQLLSSQATMFRIADRDYGISQKIIHLDTGMSLSAIGQYARGETAMSGPAILKLAHMTQFPSEILSILLDGCNRHIEDGEDDGDSALDDLGDAADDVAREVRRARHPESPGGTAIVEIERERIKRSALRLKSKRRRAA